MGKKRKSQSVSKLSAAKRQALSWNLLDDSTNPESCERPSTSSQQPQTRRKVVTFEEDVIVDAVGDDSSIPPFHISRSHHKKLYNECDYSISIHHKGYSLDRKDLIGTLSDFKLHLQEIESGGRKLPNQLPSQPANFMINHSGRPYHVVFDEVESKEGGRRSGPFLCMLAKPDLIPLESIEYLCRINKGSRLRLEVKSYDPRESSMTVGFHLLKGGITQLSHPSDYPPNSKKASDDRRHIHLLMTYCFGFNPPVPLDRRLLTHRNFTDVFQQIYQYHQHEWLNTHDLHIQHKGLIPTLRPYQVKAIQWMIQKEMADGKGKDDDGLHELWKEITTVDEKMLYYNTFSAQFSLTPLHKLPSSPGGILADEMGLGKTVEMLACILNNPRPSKQLQRVDSDGPQSIGGSSSTKQMTPSTMPAADVGTPCDTAGSDSFKNRGASTSKSEPSPSPELIGDDKDAFASSKSATYSPPGDIKRNISCDSANVDGSSINSGAASQNGSSSTPEYVVESRDGSSSSESATSPLRDAGRGNISRNTSFDSLISSPDESDNPPQNRSSASMSDGSVDDSGIGVDSPASLGSDDNDGETIRATDSAGAVVRGQTNMSRGTPQGHPADKRSVCGSFDEDNSPSRPAGSVDGYSAGKADKTILGTDRLVARRTRPVDFVRCKAGEHPGDVMRRLRKANGETDEASATGTRQFNIYDATGQGYPADLVKRIWGSLARGQSSERLTASGGDRATQETGSGVVTETIRINVFHETGQELPTGNERNSCDSVDGDNTSTGLSVSGEGHDAAADDRGESADMERTKQENVSTGMELEHPVNIEENVCGSLDEGNSAPYPTPGIGGDVAMDTGQTTVSMGTRKGPAAGTGKIASESVVRESPPSAGSAEGCLAQEDSPAGLSESADSCGAAKNGRITKENDKVFGAMESGQMSVSLEIGHSVQEGSPARMTESTDHVAAAKTETAMQGSGKLVDGVKEPSARCGGKAMDHGENQEVAERDKECSEVPSEEAVEEPIIVKLSCLCGQEEGVEESSIQCEKCNSRQHAECVNWGTGKQQPFSERTARYLCPHCQTREAPVESAATLIISPSSISQQWVDEINRHIRSQSLNILVYKGVKVHRFLQPAFLAEQDIVITTYDVLRTELHYVNVPHASDSTDSRELRHAKRYMAVPSPLPAVEWWRVCLDEAQMVECPTAKSAEMALHLTAVNRWCVTGTPIQTSLDDLYGLFLFLNEDPYRTKFWWDLALCSPFTRGYQEPMLRFLSKKLWRTAKSNVLDQINIPSQAEEVHWLKFSPVEAHYYKRKHESCARDFSMALERTKVDLTMKLADMDRRTLSRLVCPLLSLRQACCHPQAVRGEFIRIDQRTMKMEDLLQSLISKNKLECEDAQRQLVCAINGQAAVHLMSGEVVEAVEKYRDVLRTADEQKGKLHVDSLQIYHAMYNLSKLLVEKHEGVAPTTRDDQLQKQMQELQDKYMSKALTLVADCCEALSPISKKIRELRKMLPENRPGWWLHGIDYLVDQGLEERMVEKMKDDTQRLSERFHDYRGLTYVIQDEVESLMRCFKEAKAGVQSLSGPVTPQLVSQTVDCHLRPFRGQPKNDCQFCQVERSLQDYEMQLFSFQQRDFLDAMMDNAPSTSEGQAHTIRPRGTWAMSELQKILKNLQTFLKTYCNYPDILEEAANYLEMMELMKKEFKPLRAYWGALLERVAAVDELDMAKMRLRVKLPDEPYDPDSQPYIILPTEIPAQKMKLMSDRIVASSELRRKIGQLVYLQNLEKAQYSLEGSNPEPCPICTRELGEEWAIIPCGHCFCCECMSVLHSRNPSQKMKCPVCRQTAQRKEVSFVRVGEKGGESESSIKVLGGYSSKVEAVVRALIRIQREDPGAKSLVFSAWQDVLNIISRALQDNHVSFHLITQVGHKHFADKISDFKSNPKISALLLPLNVACNGLNIVEATHVLLVEPILNPATELQAIGRVHRIGQTRRTIIHRFFVRETIEEELHKYLKANPLNKAINDKSETGNLTVDQLRGMLSFQDQGQVEM